MVLDKVQVAAYETRKIDLGDFAADYKGAIFEVWVTPTRAHMRQFEQLAAPIQEQAARIKRGEKIPPEESLRVMSEYEDALLEWHAEVWRNIPLDEARQIREALEENCPGALDWLLKRTSETIGDFRRERLKN